MSDDSTASMWIRMLGLEEIWRVANSTDFQAQIAGIFAAIMETRIRAERIEFKLDALLDRMEIPDAVVPRRFPDAGLFAGRTGNGSGTRPAAITAVDAGSGAAPEAAGGVVQGPRPVGNGSGAAVRQPAGLGAK